MDRCKSNPLIVSDNRLGPVAVVPVKIPNRNALDAVFQRVQRGDSDVAEVTKTHCAVSRGMMSRRPHEANASRLSMPRMLPNAAPAERHAWS